MVGTMTKALSKNPKWVANRGAKKLSAPEAPVAPGGGNTEPTSKQVSMAKRWCFTWNNYPENWVALIVPKFLGSGCKFICKPEVGESGTPHIQGYVEAPERIRPMGFFDLCKEIHWEGAKGTRKQNRIYCFKERSADMQTNIQIPYENPVITPKPGWQMCLAAKLAIRADNRTIMWYWSMEGGCGKSTMTRWILDQEDLCAIMASGKACDMKQAIVSEIAAEREVRVCIMDVPRSSHKYISYTGLEELKNGTFYSSKYEGGQVKMPYPHVLVFANYPPDMENVDLSVDRLDVVYVGEGEAPMGADEWGNFYW